MSLTILNDWAIINKQSQIYICSYLQVITSLCNVGLCAVFKLDLLKHICIATILVGANFYAVPSHYFLIFFVIVTCNINSDALVLLHFKFSHRNVKHYYVNINLHFLICLFCSRSKDQIVSVSIPNVLMHYVILWTWSYVSNSEHCYAAPLV